jgi:hypothetical protein
MTKGFHNTTSNNIKNPLKKGNKTGLKMHHTKNLKGSGLSEPSSPLK